MADSLREQFARIRNRTAGSDEPIVRACRIAGIDPDKLLREQPVEVVIDVVERVARSGSEDRLVKPDTGYALRFLDLPLAKAGEEIDLQRVAERYAAHMHGLPEARRAVLGVDRDLGLQYVTVTKLEETPFDYPKICYTSTRWVREAPGATGQPEEGEWRLDDNLDHYDPDTAVSAMQPPTAGDPERDRAASYREAEIPFELAAELGLADAWIGNDYEAVRQGAVRDGFSAPEISAILAAADEGRVATMGEIAAAGREPAVLCAATEAQELSRGTR